MPAAIPYIIYAVGTLLGTYGAVIAVATIVASALVSNYQKRKAKREAIDAYNASLEDRLVMTATANGPRSRVYGRARNVDGIVFKGTWGNNQEFYTLVIPIAGHEIDGVEKIYFNDQPVTLASDGIPVTGGAVGGVGYNVMSSPYLRQSYSSGGVNATVTGGVGSVVLPHTPVAGSVTAVIRIDGDAYNATVNVVGTTVNITAAPYDGVYDVAYQWVTDASKAKVWIYNGAPGQTLYPLLSTRFPSLLTATDKFSGMALIVAELTYDQDAFPTGVPNISAVMRGAKILDTRTGITAWTENPAMIARDWALYPYGGACQASDINEASFIAAANACDVSTVFPLTTGTETRPLYQCGIVCSTDVKPDDNFGEMIEAMAGEWGFAGGQIKVVAGVYRAPVAAIDATWLSGTQSVGVVKDAPKADLVNHFKPVISNAGNWTDGTTNFSSVSYTSTPMPSVRSETFIAADGQELVRENTMLGVTRSVHAQHICNVQMRKLRDGMLVQLPCNMRAWPLELFDVVTLTLPVFGFVAKQFEVQGWKYEVENGVMLTLKETDASIYSTVNTLNVLDAALNTTLPLPWYVQAVTGLTITNGGASYQDGWPVSRTIVSWNLPTDSSIVNSGRIELQYARTSDVVAGSDDWTSVVTDGSTTSVTLDGLQARTSYVFRIRGINSLGVRGPWSVQVAYIVADPPPLDTPGLAAGAATEIVQGAVDNTIYVGSFAGSYPGQVQVTPSVNCKITIFAEANIQATNSSGSAQKVNAVLSIQGYDSTAATFIGDERVYKRDIQNAESWQDTPSMTYQIDAIAGRTYTIGLYYSDNIARTQVSELTKIRLRLELIKR
jgi:hypothetical protein